MNINKPCKHCHQPVKKKIYNFCSRECANKNKIKIHIRICKSCKKEFVLKNIAYERRKNRKNSGQFCSSSCGTRKYYFNERIFNVIDSEEKAYWLGFLFGDGYQNGQEMIVNLSIKDENHLEKLKYFMGSNLELKTKFNKSKPGAKLSEIITLRLASKLLCLDLNNLGCVQAKSKIIRIPALPSPLIRHFIRGVFDADGCLYFDKKKRVRRFSIFSGSVGFINDLKSILDSVGLITTITCNNNQINCSRKDHIDMLYQYFYKDSNCFLERKQIKFLSHLV